ncbi:hypothetical protein HQ576_00205 [bacterium]|nr:hypothetical protein [bacterium]
MSATRPNPNGAPASVVGPVDGIVWVLFAVAMVASLYVLIRGPEEMSTPLTHTLVQVRMLALVASVLGAACGVWRILKRQGDDGLFGMAVVFNLILGTFWVLRFALGGVGVVAS